jgi:hypothetical protein
VDICAVVVRIGVVGVVVFSVLMLVLAGEVEVVAASHSRRPPRGICCTTTRLPRTSACLGAWVRIVINGGLKVEDKCRSKRERERIR